MSCTTLQCPALPADCPPHLLTTDTEGCCPLCAGAQQFSRTHHGQSCLYLNPLISESCSILDAPRNETEPGSIELNIPGHSHCLNTESLVGWRSCRGSCTSGTYWDSAGGSFVSSCLCCQASSMAEVTISVMCSDGHRDSREMLVPTSCQCVQCHQQDQAAHRPLHLSLQVAPEDTDRDHAGYQLAEVSPQHTSQVIDPILTK